MILEETNDRLLYAGNANSSRHHSQYICRGLLLCISLFFGKLDFGSSRHLIILTEHLYIPTCIELEEGRYLGMKPLEDLGIDGETILRQILQEVHVSALNIAI